MPQLSIVIPVYQVVHYLDTCLQRVVSQSLSDFEILLVDDGSTDGSAELCDVWAKKDSRIRQLSLQNCILFTDGARPSTVGIPFSAHGCTVLSAVRSRHTR